MTLVRVIILMGIICVVPSFSFGQITIECLNNEEITGPECYDCTAASDTALFTGFRIIHAGVDTTMVESPWRLKVRRSTNEWIFIDYRDQIKFSTVANLTDFASLDELIAYVKDCQSFVVDYAGDSTAVIHWGDTMHITYPEPGMGGGGGDTTYYWVRQVNGVGNDTITVGEVENLVAGTNITIGQGATNITFNVPNMRDTCRHELVQVSDTTAALLDCLGDTMGIIAFAFPDGLQHLYALPDSSNRLILTDGDGTPMDTVEFFGIGLFNDLRLDSLRYADDTLTAFIRDTSGIVDSIKVEIVLGDTDTDIDSMKLIGNVLHLYEDEIELTVDLSQFMDNTDDQKIDVFSFDNGTRTLSLSLEDDGEATKTLVIPDDTGTDDQQLSLVTDGLIDTIFLEDGGFVVLHDSVGSGITTNDTYLSATWCSGDTLFAERSDTSGIIDTLIVAGIPCSRDTCEILVEQITFGSAFGYSLVTGLRYTYCGVVDSVCFIGTIKYIPYQHDHDSLYFLTETIVDCDSVTIGLLSVYIKPSNDIRVDTSWFVDDTLYQQRVDTSGIIDTIITEILTKDFDFILLDGDTMVTLVDTLIPRDSADLHKLIWHGGRVRLGLPAYEHSIYLDTTTGNYLNFVLHQDSVDTGLQIFGRRSALDIYHHTRPYQHFRNQFGEFWQRIFDPTAEGPLQPQRWEFGAVGKYDSDTTSRPIFTIDNDADAFSLNITPGYLQSDIYASDRPVDTANVYAITGVDSSGRFILLQLDSIGDINITNPNDSDWLRIPDYGIPNYDEDKFTLGRVRIGIDSLSTASAKVIIQGGVVPLITRSTASSSLHRQHTLGNNIAWDFASVSGDYVIDRVDLGASTTERYFWLHGGSGLSGAAHFEMDIDGEIELGAYSATRDDGASSADITRIYYPASGGHLLMASIDSLAAALQLTGIISGSDSLGRDGTDGQVVIETATKAGTSYSEFTASSTQVVTPPGLRVGLNRAGDGASNLDLVSVVGQPFSTRLFRASGANGGFTFQNAGTGNLSFSVNSSDLGFVVRGTDRSIAFPSYTSTASFPGTAVGLIGFDASGNLLTEALVTGDLLGTAFPTGQIVYGDGTTTGTSSPNFIASAGVSSGIVFNTANGSGDTYLDLSNSIDNADTWRLYRAASGNFGLGYSSTLAYGGTSIPFVIEAGAPTGLFRIDIDGIGINTVIPAQTFHVQGTARITGSDGTATTIMGRNGSGDISNITAGTGLSISGGVLNNTLGGFDPTANIAFSGNNTHTGTENFIGVDRVSIINDGSLGAYFNMQAANSGGVAAGIKSYAHGGTVASPTATLSGQFLGLWTGRGHDATGLTGNARAYMAMIADANWSSGNTPTRIVLATTPSASGTVQARMTIGSSGAVTVANLAGTGTRMVTATSTGVLGTAAIPSGGDGNGIYTATGNIGGGVATVTASVGTSFNFNIAHQSINKLGIGTSGTFLRSTTGASVLVGETTNEMAFYYNSGSTETRMRANNAGTGSYVYVANDGNMGMRATGTGDNILLQASGNVHLASSTADIILSSGGAAGDATSISGFDYVNISANSTTGIIELVPASGGSGALYVLGSGGSLHLSNTTTTTGSSDYISLGTTTIGLNINATTAVGVSLASVEIHGGTTNTYNLEVNGTASRVGGTTWANESDRRLKEDIVSIDDSYEKILGLNPVTFRYNEQYLSTRNAEDRTYTGFIAQEYREVFPEDVQGDEETGTLSISPDAVGPYTVAAVQQLIRDNEQQAAQINVLTDQINKLYDLINKK